MTRTIVAGPSADAAPGLVPGKRLLIAALAVAVAVAVTSSTACPTTPPELPGEQQRRAFTANVADHIVVPRIARLVTETGALRDTTAAHDAAAGDDVAARDAARDAWRAAMTTWQELEMLHLGPAGSPASFVGGLGLRERVYAWPQVNLCALDSQVLLGEFRDDGWADTRLPNVIGMSAVEYNLFVEGDGNACPETAGLNADGTWAALGSAEIRARRAGYAAVVAADIAVKAEALQRAWLEDVVDEAGAITAPAFATSLRTAGEGGSAFSTAQQALDELYAALFAVELVTKDLRLGVPAGVHIGCENASGICPERAESIHARASKENIAANLRAVRAVFLGIGADGEDDTGFDDLLREKNAGDLASTMTSKLDAALDAATAFDGTLEDALATEPERVIVLHAAVKTFTDDFKSTFASTLGLRVPDEGAGDND